jgi:hypothetical protein
MTKKVVLLAVALTLALPAFADAPNAISKTAKVPVSKVPARKPTRTGNEVHSFSYKVTAPLDNNSSGQPVGKRKHNPIPPKPPK